MTALPGCLMFTRDLIRILIPVKGKSSHLSDCHCQAPTPRLLGWTPTRDRNSLVDPHSFSSLLHQDGSGDWTNMSLCPLERVCAAQLRRPTSEFELQCQRETQEALVDFDRQGLRSHTKPCIPTGRTPRSIPPYGTGWTRMAVFPSFHKELLQAGRHAARFPGSRTRYHKFITLSVSTGVVTVRRPGIG